MSTRQLLVVLRRLECRKEAAAHSWADLRGDLRNPDKLHTYVTALRKCEVLRDLAIGHSAGRASSMN